jgi:hypothetical protein
MTDVDLEAIAIILLDVRSLEGLLLANVVTRGNGGAEKGVFNVKVVRDHWRGAGNVACFFRRGLLLGGGVFADDGLFAL